MNKVVKPISINSQHPLVGVWSSLDEFSDVQIVIKATANGLDIEAVDKSDNEVAEVFGVECEEIKLAFNLHWPTTGRFIKYTFTLISSDKVDVTYTYSGQEVWLKRK